VSLNDWILSLHLLSAFAYVAAEVVFTAMIVSLWRTESTRRVSSFMPVSRIATGLVLLGSLGTLVFGIWLSISKEPYDLWDFWVIAAIVLWAVAGGLGQQAGNAYGSAGMEATRLATSGTETNPALAETFGASRAFWFHLVSTVAILAILVLMVWKPGA
jgi:uncharacterized membrane protein